MALKKAFLHLFPIFSDVFEYFTIYSDWTLVEGLRIFGLGCNDMDKVIQPEYFLTHRPSFFYENGHNSETKSPKIDHKVGNESFLRGLQTGG